MRIKKNLIVAISLTIVSLGISDTYAQGPVISSPIAGAWEKVNAGALDGQVTRSLTVDSSGNLYASSAGGVWRSTDNGNTWERFRAYERFDIYNPIIAFGNTVLGGFRDTLFSSSDAGVTWVPQWMPDFSGLLKVDFRDFHKTDSFLFVGSALGVHRSTDNGQTWTEKNNGLLSNVLARDFSGTDTSLYIASPSGVYRTNDDGENWSRLWNRSGDPLQCESVLISEGRLFAGNGSYGLYLSEDDGATWTKIQVGGGIDSNTVFTLRKIDGILYAGTAKYFTTSGVYFSTDNGDTWYDISEGIQDNDWIFDIMIHGNYIYAAAHGGGVLRRSVTDFVTSVQESPSTTGVPETFSLDQNFPNPFNPSTNVRFSLPTASSVRVEVFNILGQTVAVLQEGDLQAGYHTVQWNAQVATGLYFYRIEATSASDPGVTFNAVKKMMLVK